MVDHDHDAIKTITLGEIHNEIASDLRKQGSILLSFDWNEARGGQVCVDFYLLTNGAARNIVLDEDHHSWPPIVTSYEFECL